MIQQSCTNYARGSKMLFPMLLSALLLFLFGSCTDEQINNPTPNGEEKQITLSLTTPKSFIAATYADPAAVDENKIQTIDVLVFDAAGKYFSGPHFASLGNVGSGPVDVKVNVPKDVAENFTLAVFANSRKAINAVASTFATSEDKETTLKKIVLDDKAATSQWETFESKNLIPMHAEVDFSAIASTVSLVRMVARIDVTVTDETLADFDLKTVRLYKHNTAGYVAPIAVTGTPSIPGGTIKATSPLLYSTASNEVKNEIYTFEAAASDGASFEDNTCIVIGGQYKDDAADSYYRVDFYGKKQGMSDNAYLALLRNHLYTVSVSKVYGPGYDDPDKAAASKPINVTYNIDAWDTSTIVDGGYNGQYFLGVSAAKFSFDAAARDNSTGDNVLIIKTNHPDGWSWSVDTSNESWLALTKMDGTEITAGTLVQATSSEVRLDLQSNVGGSDRSADIKLTAGNVTYTINVSQSGSLNSDNLFPSEAADYSLRPNGDRIFIPVSRANAGGTTIKLNPGDVFTVTSSETKVDATMPVIKAVKPVGTGASGQVYVETGTGSGTATITLKDASDATLCSWTITVREPEANSYIVKPNSEILIPVSQISNFKRDLIKLTDNSDQTIATDANAANAWFDDGTAFTADWVWKDQTGLEVTATPVGADGINGYVKVRVAGATNGNAVVAISQGDIIRWSWHLWISALEPQGQYDSTTGLTFMDRNLGASNTTEGDIGSFGLHYQWGRKDPFPAPLAANASNPGEPTATTTYNTAFNTGTGTKSLAIKKVGIPSNMDMSSTIPASDFAPTRLNSTTVNNVDYTVANPHIFYWRGTNNELYDWYCFGTVNDGANQVKQNNNLWGGYSSAVAADGSRLDIKTSLDPCPPGWRVPKSNTLNTTAVYESSNFVWDVNSTPFGLAATYSKSTGYDASTNKVTNGYTRTYSSGTAWYPAAGARTVSSGDFWGVGTDGYYWSSSPYAATGSIAAGFLTFDSNSPSPFSYGFRGDGYSVRCVQE